MMGADASFRLSQNNTLLGYYASTEVPGSAAEASSYRGRFEYAGDRYGLIAEHLMVGAGFVPEVGYTRRENFRRETGTARFSPRLKSNRYMRKLTAQGTFTYDTDADMTRVENRTIDGGFGIEFHSGDTAAIQYTGEYELLPQNFRIATGVIVPQGGYDNKTVGANYSLASNRTVAGRFAVAGGPFYDGTKTETSVLRPYRGDAAVRTRAEHLAGMGAAAVRRFQRAPHRKPLHLHADHAPVRQQPHSIQR